jgi:hypothetical protein
MLLAALLIFFLLSIGFHAVAGRLSFIANSVLRFFAVGTVMGLLLIVWLVGRYGLGSAELVTGVLTYAFLCNLYIFLFTATLSSISTNLLFRLSREALAPDDVERLYSGRAMAEVRIKRLIDAGFLAKGTTGLTLTIAGAKSVATYGHLRRFFKHVNDI